MKKNEAGFTLMEIIVVIVIISLMVGFAVPKLDSFLSEDKSKKGIRIFCSYIRELKLEALKKSQDFVLVIDPDSDKFWIDVDDEETAQKKSPGKDIDIAGVQSGYIDYSTTSKIYVRFYSKGYNDPFVVTLKNRIDNKIFTIAVNPFLASPVIYNKLCFFEECFS
ncbi:MAG: prepilin-type N-terminal cleavage/methylation domain-containing protein [Desulforegulaceae bacterium]|jgi:prepilin-type N-terminal cleavage/methylation domain-containing protein|nr:prepilin-type N-terminal cleavage/methylation domain-containing protein [Desulforegulaceae bacterium]